MRAEIWISIYAAIVGTGALLLNFKNWLDSGIKLKMSLIPDGVITGGDPRFDERNIVIVSITNRGDAPTMITGLHFFEFSSLWRRWRRRPDQAFIVLNPQLLGFPPNVPSELGPSKTWTGVIRERNDFVADIHSGNFYAGVYCSSYDKPCLRRIPKRKSKSGEPATKCSSPANDGQ